MNTFLRIGDRGGDVVTWQNFLTSHGFPVTPDGLFGPATAAATRGLQETLGVRTTGNFDEETLLAMRGKVVGVEEGDVKEVLSTSRNLPEQKVFGGLGLIALAVLAGVIIFGSGGKS